MGGPITTMVIQLLHVAAMCAVYFPADIAIRYTFKKVRSTMRGKSSNKARQHSINLRKIRKENKVNGHR